MGYDKKTVGGRIANRRKELQHNQEYVADKAGISKNHLSSIENGKDGMSIDLLLDLCDILNTTPDYLLLGCTHSYDKNMNLLNTILLCSDEDTVLMQDIAELMVKRNSKSFNSNHF